MPPTYAKYKSEYNNKCNNATNIHMILVFLHIHIPYFYL